MAVDNLTKAKIHATTIWVWTLLTAALGTAAWVDKRAFFIVGVDAEGNDLSICDTPKPDENDLGWKKICGWKTYITFAWVAFIQASVILAFAFCNKVNAAGNNAVLAVMFSALYIGMLAPDYVQTGIWKDSAGNRPAWMKMEVTSLIFAGFGLFKSFSFVSGLLHFLNVARGKKTTVESA